MHDFIDAIRFKEYTISCYLNLVFLPHLSLKKPKKNNKHEYKKPVADPEFWNKGSLPSNFF